MSMFEFMQQLVLGACGSLGFALIFKMPNNKLVFAAIGGMICWGGYLFGHLYLGLGILSASLFCTVLATLFAEVVARIVHVPTPMLAITAYIPLIPGKGLYYTMSNAVARNWDFTASYAIQTVQCAFGMAFGMSLVFALFAINAKLMQMKKEAVAK